MSTKSLTGENLWKDVNNDNEAATTVSSPPKLIYWNAIETRYRERLFEKLNESQIKRHKDMDDAMLQLMHDKIDQDQRNVFEKTWQSFSERWRMIDEMNMYLLSSDTMLKDYIEKLCVHDQKENGYKVIMEENIIDDNIIDATDNIGGEQNKVSEKKKNWSSYLSSCLSEEDHLLAKDVKKLRIEKEALTNSITKLNTYLDDNFLSGDVLQRRSILRRLRTYEKNLNNHIDIFIDDVRLKLDSVSSYTNQQTKGNQHNRNKLTDAWYQHIVETYYNVDDINNNTKSTNLTPMELIYKGIYKEVNAELTKKEIELKEVIESVMGFDMNHHSNDENSRTEDPNLKNNASNNDWQGVTCGSKIRRSITDFIKVSPDDRDIPTKLKRPGSINSNTFGDTLFKPQDSCSADETAYNGNVISSMINNNGDDIENNGLHKAPDSTVTRILPPLMPLKQSLFTKQTGAPFVVRKKQTDDIEKGHNGYNNIEGLPCRQFFPEDDVDVNKVDTKDKNCHSDEVMSSSKPNLRRLSSNLFLSAAGSLFLNKVQNEISSSRSSIEKVTEVSTKDHIITDNDEIIVPLNEDSEKKTVFKYNDMMGEEGESHHQISCDENNENNISPDQNKHESVPPSSENPIMKNDNYCEGIVVNKLDDSTMNKNTKDLIIEKENDDMMIPNENNNDVIEKHTMSPSSIATSSNSYSTSETKKKLAWITPFGTCHEKQYDNKIDKDSPKIEKEEEVFRCKTGDILPSPVSMSKIVGKCIIFIFA